MTRSIRIIEEGDDSQGCRRVPDINQIEYGFGKRHALTAAQSSRKVSVHRGTHTQIKEKPLAGALSH